MVKGQASFTSNLVAVIAVGITLAIGHIIANRVKAGMSDISTTASNTTLTQLATSLTLGDIIPIVLIASVIIGVLVSAFRA